MTFYLIVLFFFHYDFDFLAWQKWAFRETSYHHLYTLTFTAHYQAITKMITK